MILNTTNPSSRLQLQENPTQGGSMPSSQGTFRLHLSAGSHIAPHLQQPMASHVPTMPPSHSFYNTASLQFSTASGTTAFTSGAASSVSPLRSGASCRCTASAACSLHMGSFACAMPPVHPQSAEKAADRRTHNEMAPSSAQPQQVHKSDHWPPFAFPLPSYPPMNHSLPKVPPAGAAPMRQSQPAAPIGAQPVPPDSRTSSTVQPQGRLQQDLDVQRILWSQDVDLGVNFNWPELASFPTGKEAAGAVKDPAKAELDPYLVATVLPQPRGLSRNSSTNFIDSETGESLPMTSSVRSLCATGNGTVDPLPNQAFNRTGQPFCPPLNGSAAGNLTTLEADMENRNLQNLIDAINNLNASTLQAIGGREALVQTNAAEDFLQDMQAVIGERPGEQVSSIGNLTRPLSLGERNQTAANGNTEQNGVAAFNLSSIFIDPPANYSLAMSPLQQEQQQQPPPKSDTYRFPPILGMNDATTTQCNGMPARPRLMTNVCQERVPGNGLVSHVSGGASGGSMLSGPGQGQMRPGAGINHEGPFDFSAFPFQDGEPLLLSDSGFLSSVTAMDTLSPNLQQVPQMNGTAFLEHATLFDFGSGSPDWNQNCSGVRGNGLSSVMSESSDFNITNLGGFFPAVNSSGNLLPPPMSNASSNISNEWKLSDQVPGTMQTLHNNSADVLMMLDEAKMRIMMEEAEKLSSQGAGQEQPVEDKHVVPEIKQEDVELDPWTEHANFAARHNHSYARHEHTVQSRESSEEVGSASAADSSGSTHGRSRGGSVSMGELRNRPNRDDRAASELGLPVSAEEIVNMPVEEFNSFVSGQSLTLNQEQIQLMKDIRRRGKNKVAAQNCRRRKIDNMSHLEREIYNLRQDLAQATARRDEAARQREMYRSALANPVSVVQSSGPQQSVHGSFGQNHVSVLVAPASANAQGDQPSNKRIARDTTSDQLRKRKRDA